MHKTCISLAARIDAGNTSINKKALLNKGSIYKDANQGVDRKVYV